ncbi:hypothetical protein C0J52_26062 [Blattella germanica]|nr:hypothetical protein C0J52_26062 [Blattella germanica]
MAFPDSQKFWFVITVEGFSDQLPETLTNVASQKKKNIVAAIGTFSFLNELKLVNCLSPRSAYFYEFPPNELSLNTKVLSVSERRQCKQQDAIFWYLPMCAFNVYEQSGGQQTNKKKTSFSRFLRGLKTGHRKEKHSGSSPRHTRTSARGPQAGRTQKHRKGMPLTTDEKRIVLNVFYKLSEKYREVAINDITEMTSEFAVFGMRIPEPLVLVTHLQVHRGTLVFSSRLISTGKHLVCALQMLVPSQDESMDQNPEVPDTFTVKSRITVKRTTRMTWDGEERSKEKNRPTCWTLKGLRNVLQFRKKIISWASIAVYGSNFLHFEADSLLHMLARHVFPPPSAVENWLVKGEKVRDRIVTFLIRLWCFTTRFGGRYSISVPLLLGQCIL